MTTAVRQHDFEVGLVTMGRVESVCVLVSWSWLGCDDVSKLEWAKISSFVCEIQMWSQEHEPMIVVSLYGTSSFFVPFHLDAV